MMDDRDKRLGEILVANPGIAAAGTHLAGAVVVIGVAVAVIVPHIAVRVCAALVAAPVAVAAPLAAGVGVVAVSIAGAIDPA